MARLMPKGHGPPPNMEGGGEACGIYTRWSRPAWRRSQSRNHSLLRIIGIRFIEGDVMKLRQAIASGALAMIASASFSAEPPTAAKSLTRAQVKQEAIQARIAGQTSVGDDPLYPERRVPRPGKPIKWRTKKVDRGSANTYHDEK